MLIRRVVRIAFFVLLAALPGQGLVFAAPDAQEQTDPLTLEVRAGFGGIIQQGTYTPITVVAANTGDDVDGELSVDVSSITGGGATYLQPIQLPKGSRKLVRLYPANFNAFGNEITVVLSQNGRRLKETKVKVEFIDQRRLLIGVWSDTPGVLASLGKIETQSGKAAVAILTADDLPPSAEAWNSLDVLVVSNTDTGKLAPEQQAALAGWLNQGGRLIIAPGPGFQKTMAGLAGVSPMLPDSTNNVTLGFLGQATGQPFPQAAAETPVVTGKMTSDAHTLLSQGSTPVVVWRQAGYGRVDFMAADPALDPLRSWPAMDALWTLILVDGEARPGWAYGFNLTTEPAQSAIAAVPGVTLPSVLELCGFLMAYMILIGPVNYFVLHRLKRRELAWVTIPGLVILFSGVAYFTGFQLRGTQAILHRLAVIETWPGSDTAEVGMLFGVWSPGRTAYDIQIEPGYLARPLTRDFTGSLSSAPNVRIEDGQNVTLRDVQVDIGSIQPFVIEGFMPNAPRFDGELTITPTEDGIQIQGEVINYSSTTLTSVSLITPIGSARLENLPAGGVLKVDVPLSAGQSSAAAGTGLEPFPDSSGYYYYTPYGGGSLASDLTSGEDCYDTSKDLRHCNLAASILNSEARGSGVYLSGWTDSIPVRTQVLNASSQQKDVALIIAQMTTSVAQGAETLRTIPPGLMSWRITDDGTSSTYSSYSGYTPYNLYLTQNVPVMVHYQPLGFVPNVNVNKVIIHMTGYDQTVLPKVEIWNAAEGRWVTEQIHWGDTELPAEDYVDGQNGVTLRISIGDTDTYGLDLNRLDITLVGQ